jgi:hypothetical protein
MAATVKATKAVATKRPAARRPKATPVTEANGRGIQVLRLTTGTTEAARVPLFYIDDREYTVKASPGMNIALQFLHIGRTQGEGIAIDYLLGKMLGDEAYKALREYDDLTAEQLMQIIETVTSLAMGAMELPKA